MTILPRWFQISFLTAAAVGIVYVFAMHVVLSAGIEDLSNIEQSSIGEITLLPPAGQSVEVATDTWNEIRATFQGGKRVSFIGWKGEAWTNFCTLMIQTADSDFAYLLDLKTRPSMEGQIIFEIQRGSEHSQWVFKSYEGNALLLYLQHNFPRSCHS